MAREARRTVDAINECKRVENRDLRAAWLPSHERCWECGGTGKLNVYTAGFVFEADSPCDECGGTGRDYPGPGADEAIFGDESWIDHDELPDYLQDGWDR